MSATASNTDILYNQYMSIERIFLNPCVLMIRPDLQRQQSHLKSSLEVTHNVKTNHQALFFNTSLCSLKQWPQARSHLPGGVATVDEWEAPT